MANEVSDIIFGFSSGGGLCTAMPAFGDIALEDARSACQLREQQQKREQPQQQQQQQWRQQWWRQHQQQKREQQQQQHQQ